MDRRIQTHRATTAKFAEKKSVTPWSLWVTFCRAYVTTLLPAQRTRMGMIVAHRAVREHAHTLFQLTLLMMILSHWATLSQTFDRECSNHTS